MDNILYCMLNFKSKFIIRVDLVQSQIRIAEGKTLKDIGAEQKDISLKGCAIQCRMTTEDPARAFQPDTGRIEVININQSEGCIMDVWLWWLTTKPETRVESHFFMNIIFITLIILSWIDWPNRIDIVVKHHFIHLIIENGKQDWSYGLVVEHSTINMNSVIIFIYSFYELHSFKNVSKSVRLLCEIF